VAAVTAEVCLSHSVAFAVSEVSLAAAFWAVNFGTFCSIDYVFRDDSATMRAVECLLFHKGSPIARYAKKRGFVRVKSRAREGFKSPPVH
jgi:hypothetical protein